MRNILKISLAIISLIFFYCEKNDKIGCLDSKACNYDSEAVIDSHECEYCDSIEFHINFLEMIDNNQVIYNNNYYNNEAGNQFNITKLHYMVSDIVLYNSSNDSIVTDVYYLKTIENYNYIRKFKIPKNFKDIVKVKLTFGMDEEDNVSGLYQDLNLASWSWPTQIGGGYHFMQFEGKFVKTNNDTTNYQLHMGTAMKKDSQGNILSEINNHFDIINNIDNISLNYSSYVGVNIKLDVLEIFKNPHTWDLNTSNSGLMMNYDAQLLLNQNLRDAISINKSNIDIVN